MADFGLVGYKSSSEYSDEESSGLSQSTNQEVNQSDQESVKDSYMNQVQTNVSRGINVIKDVLIKECKEDARDVNPQCREAANVLKQVVESFKAMVETLAETSRNNLEVERTRLRIIMEKNRSGQSNEKKRKLDNEENLPSSEMKKAKTIEVANKEGWKQHEMPTIHLNIKRDYRLTKESNFDLWMDCLRSELMSNDILDVIEPSSTASTRSEASTTRRKNWVRDIIINRLDENYHKKILNIREPLEIVKVLRSSRKCESNVTHTSVRARLYSIKMDRGESVSDFCDRFDAIVNEYQACEDVVELTSQEMRSAFYQAVSPVIPELRNADLIKRQTSNKEMTIDEIKSFITQLEAEKNSEGREVVPKLQRTVKVPKVRCFRCNQEGHYSNECSLRRKNKYFCYSCQAVKSHKSDECPSAGAVGGKRSPPQKNRWRKFGQKQATKREAERAQTKARKASGKSKKSPGKCCSNDFISFIADSGATEHIVNDQLVLSNFKRLNNKTIKSANKNQSADIEIDGKGDLVLHTSNSKNGYFKLFNVLAAKDVSENLLSLRKLADSGCEIFLDDKILRVYNRETNAIVLEGDYEKPNWIINFNVKKPNRLDDEFEYQRYCFRAVMMNENEMPKQSQNPNKEVELLEREGEPEKEETHSEIGREENTHLITPIDGNVLKTTVDELESKNTKDDIETWDRSLISRNVEKLEDLDEANLENLLNNNPSECNTYQSKSLSEAMLWHLRLGHASVNYLKKLQKLDERMEKVIFDDSILECEVCVMSKMQKLPFKETRKIAERPLQVIHTDIMGPIKPTSYPGQKRFINVYIDDYSRLARAYSLKTKDVSGDALEKFLISTRNLLGQNEKVCYIRSDQGTEFTGRKFLEILKKENIETEFTPPYTPEHNGVAERFNATIQRKVRAYMFDSGLPKSMWELAVDAAIHAYNRTPHKSIEYETPLIKFASNAKCHFDQIKRFGCISYIKIPKPSLKFGERALKAVLVGYTSTGYLMWHPSSKKFFESRHVKFNEKLVYKDVYKRDSLEAKENIEETNWDWMKEFREETKENIDVQNTQLRRRGRPRKESKQLLRDLEKPVIEKPLTRS